VTGIAGAVRHGPARPGEQRRSVLEVARAKAMLEWTPLTALDDGLRQTADHFRKERLP
jgi:UDP-glucose 4-epimerase